MGRGGQRVSEFGYLGRIPDFTRDVALSYVKRGYHLLCRHAITLFLLPVAGTILLELGNMAKTGELKEMWDMAAKTNLQFNMITFIGCCILLTIVALTYLFARSKPVYLIDYHCYKPPDRLKMPHQTFLELSKNCGAFTEKSMEFQTKIIERSGLGDETYLPDAVHTVPPAISMKAARDEAEMVLFECVKEALARSGLKPRQVDILIVNCSLFNPTPSLSAMIVNHFKMKSSIVSYNLSGMGCSAGVISISLAKELLQVYPNSRALVVSTENITQNWYFGNSKAMLIPNCLFRVGGAALVLTNRRSDRRRAKYELSHVVRTHMGASDASYTCVYQQEDDDGTTGVYLSKDLMAIAGHALKANITTLAPLVLPVSEQLLFFMNLIARKVFKRKIKAYIPDFKLAFEHVCIHTGGRGVVEEIEKQLSMTPTLMQPSKDTLYRYGNTSSSSIWYVLANIETKIGVKRGDRVWQIAFGSGFKCNSAIWRALRHVDTPHSVWT
ncbi:g13269 [Coccomyxa viridis]|uniref:3-ketoacyl-CoA synthase n=1 Tax=Coccomyxa viridis TaxID=1274662 RepID=A0ABP1GCF3_9CHLO